MKKHYLLLFALFSVWQINAQVLNQNAGWPNPLWTVTGTYSAAVGAFEANPTTTANFAFDDDDAGNPSDDQIAAESPIIDLTAAHTAGEQKVRVSVLYGYNYLDADVLRFEYWNADTSTWEPWGGNLPGNSTAVFDNFCSIPKTTFTSPDLDVAAFTATQLSGFKYRIYYNDSLAGADWNWGFCFNSPTIISVPTPCLTGINFPPTTTTPATCDGLTPTLISDESFAGDYFYVAVTSGETYKFTSSVVTDFFTISTDDGLTSAVSGTQPLTWVSTVTGNIRVHLNTNITCGTVDSERITNVICGTLCLNGYLYPGDTLGFEFCNGSEEVFTEDTWPGEYSNIQVYASNNYTFSSSVATDYLTLTSTNGTVAYVVGTGSVVFTPTTDEVIRFYLHTDSDCGTSTVSRERRGICTTTAVLPGCVTNPVPADGSTTVPAFATFNISWTAPTTGDPAISYDLYTGTAVDNLVFDGNVTTTTIEDVGPIGQYSFTVYWQVIARNAAGEAIGCTIWSFTTEPQPTDAVDYANLQWPPSATIVQGGTATVYGQVYEPGLTDTTIGQAPGVLAWVGISPVGDNSNPNTWTTWIPATFNVESNNNDEYQAAIGAALVPGTYYYATRFTLNGGPFVYGGINASPPNNGNFWDGATFGSGVLTVTPAPAPANDECPAAIALVVDDTFCNGTNTNGTNIGSTDSGVTPATCFAYGLNDVWYSFVAPADAATVDVSTDFLGGTLYDTEVALYSGACGALTQVACDNDGGIVLQPNGFSWNSLIINAAVTAGQTYYVRVAGYSAEQVGSFCLRVSRNQLLSNEGFDNNNFTYYPNPVKNVLHLSYNQEITSVEVFNLLGQKMSVNAIGANQGQVDMSNLASGTYMVKVTADNQVRTIKVIKE